MKQIEHKCPECGNKLVKNSNEIYCKSCGLVVEEQLIIFTEEVISDRADNLISRSGPPFRWIDPQSGSYSMVGTWKEYMNWKRKCRKNSLSN